MKSKMPIFLLLFILLFILLPTFFAYNRPESLNVLSQILFSVLLTSASIGFGYFVTKKGEMKKVPEGWVSSAEKSCLELLTISFSTESMIDSWESSCQNLPLIFPGVPQEHLDPLVKFIENQCYINAKELKILKHHIDNAYTGWRKFINQNCEPGACAAIDVTLSQKKDELTGKAPIIS